MSSSLASSLCFLIRLPPSSSSPFLLPQKRDRTGHTDETPEGKARCQAWSVDDVAEYLNRLSLGHVSDKFRENGVDGAYLLELDECDLVNELGLTKLQARKIKSRLP